MALNYAFELEVLHAYGESGSAVTRELPDHHPFAVIKSLIQDVTDKWAVPSHKFAEIVHALLIAHIKKIIANHFASFTTGGLHQRIT
jgi:hypothetical protein